MKNNATQAAGFIIPDTFEELLQVLKAAYDGLVASGTIEPQPEHKRPVIPMDYK